MKTTPGETSADLWPQRDLSVATEISLCVHRAFHREFLRGQREISLWPQRDFSVAAERSLCGHRELWPQRNLYVATKGSLCGHKKIFLWPQRDPSVATEGFLRGHGRSSQPVGLSLSRPTNNYVLRSDKMRLSQQTKIGRTAKTI